MRITLAIVLGLGVSAPLLAAQGAEDELIFQTQCALCHAEAPAPAGSPNEKAPTRAQLRQFTAEAVHTALTNGKMQIQGSTLNEAQRRIVSEYATGKRLSTAVASNGAVVNKCTSEIPMTDPARGASWNGHGNGLAATRFQPAKQAS